MQSALLDSLLADAPTVAQPAWLADAQRAAQSTLQADGLPDTRVEAWKYTNLRMLGQRKLQRGDAAAASRVVDPALLALPGVESSRVVFVNGVLRMDLSCFSWHGDLSVQPLSVALDEAGDALQTLLGRSYEQRDQAFAQLNTALLDQGVRIRVGAGLHIEQPLHVVFVGVAAEADLAWSARLLIELGAGASLGVVEHHVGVDDAHLGNLVTQISLDADARLDLIQLQNAAAGASLIRRTDASLGDRAQLVAHTLELGGQLVRHDLVVQLAGTASSVQSHGVFALRDKQHVDTHLDVRHIGRDTVCDVVWRGVVDQRARGVFHGAITIEQGADGSDAKLSNKNLLLSAQAEIDTQPVLVIHADEVKAAHGATVGQLDDRALFYLRSRGIAAADARALLTMAFCRAALESIPNPALVEAMSQLLIERLPGAGA